MMIAAVMTSADDDCGCDDKCDNDCGCDDKCDDDCGCDDKCDDDCGCDDKCVMMIVDADDDDKFPVTLFDWTTRNHNC